MAVTNKLSNFIDIVNLTKNRIDELDVDDTIDTIIKNAINQSYTHDLCKLFKKFTSTIAPVINGIATLPDDLVSIEKITPELIKGEYRKGNAIFSDRTVTFTIVYSYEPSLLINDSDIPEVPVRMFYLMSTYACHEYYNFKKRTNLAQQYLNEYNLALSDYESDNSIDEQVTDVYTMNSEDDANAVF